MKGDDSTGRPLVPEVPPSNHPPPRAWIIRPLSQRGIVCVSLSPRLYTYAVHYVPSQTADKGCRGEWALCHWCRDGYEWRLKHYLAALLLPNGGQGLLELTAKAVQYCPEITDRKRNLRGCSLKAWRLIDKRNAPMRVQLGCRRTDVALPEEPDVYGLLLHYWGETPNQPRPPSEEEA